MLKINYKISVSNPVKERMKPSETYLEYSTLEVNKVDSGYVISGIYKKNKEVIVACSNNFIGEGYYLKSGIGNKTYLEEFQTYLDVEEILKLNGKDIKNIPPMFKNNLNIASKLKGNIYKLNHILANTEDAVFFKVSNKGVLELINVICKPPSNLIEYSYDSFIAYIIVNKTLKVSPSKEYHIPNRSLENLPEGFCTLSNSLLLNNTLAVESLKQNNYVLKGLFPTLLKSSFPIKFDNVKLTEYQTHSREVLLVSVDTDYNTTLDNIVLDITDNITAIYELSEDGVLEPYIAFITKDLLEVEDRLLINKNNSKKIDILTSDKEFKKSYIVKQYKINITDSQNKKYVLYDDHFYQNILQDIIKFNKKIVKNDN